MALGGDVCSHMGLGDTSLPSERPCIFPEKILPWVELPRMDPKREGMTPLGALCHSIGFEVAGGSVSLEAFQNLFLP